ncbi:aspartate aminotransferase family protein [Siminovitchia fortis]|uniref:Aspartate aminotransferase family protein n=1 Tax=Siminovitchia fortis TaxID=254758 RepID=A0A443IVW3_9BACI|nr:aspartate aminotransferase family protein [Siminovitchia fortis]RWR12174.1 aspartate aminotransferase family protein [Siminovitchia fortis]WHY80990.1 aspartate aminotransferase family protein [Siminovitchia fortis]
MTRTYLIKPVLDHKYPSITHGEGIYLYDEQGKQYIDGSSGAVTASIGHGVQEIIEAMAEQSKKVSFVYRSQFTTGAAEQLAKKISEITPGDLNWSFFVNSGSEATETAMKIAIQYWQEKGMKTKNKIISRWMSYHGITMGALSMSGHIQRRERFEPMLESYPSISAPYYYRDAGQRTIEECDDFYAQELEKEILRVGKDHIAAFIAEPMIGAAGGALTPSDGYFQKMKAVCDRHDILFIADEVMTGVGRTGKMFAMEHFNVIPDIMATGKGMSAGYTPMAAAVVSERVMEPILNGSKIVMSGHTFSANPQSAATSLAVLNYIEKNNLVENSAVNGAYLKERVCELAEASKIIGDVRGKGLFVGIEFVEDKLTKKSFERALDVVNKIVEANFAEGLLVYPANAGADGLTGDAVILSPPLTITREEVDELVRRFAVALGKVERELLGELSKR